MKRIYCLVLVLLLLLGVSVESVEAKKRNQNKTSQSKTSQTKSSLRKRGQFVLAPIPVSNPAVGSGLVLVAGYVFKLTESDTVSPPSTVGLAGAFTSNGSRGGGLAARLYFDENRYQTTRAHVDHRHRRGFLNDPEFNACRKRNWTLIMS